MPDSLEYIVRPYQTPNVHGAIIIPSRPVGSRQRANITWGAAGTMPELTEVDTGEGLGFEVICCEERLGETSRKSETKRIFQNNDTSSSNWVDVRRPLELKLKKKENNKCGGSSISFAAQEVSAIVAQWETAIHSGTAAPFKKNCGVRWQFKNEPAQ